MADQRDRLGGRNGELWRAYTSGRTQEWIAERHGIAQSTVSEIIGEVRKSLPEDARADWRLCALETLGHLHAEMVELANGTPTRVTDPETGDLLEVDHSNRLAAVDRVLKIQERAGRMLGTDAATKTEVSGAVRYTIDGIDPEVLR